MHGVGLDLVEIDEIRDSIQSFGERYLGRVFTPAELNECGTSPARLAERFAAKEAILKALQVDGAVPMASIDTRADGPARPHRTAGRRGCGTGGAARRGPHRGQHQPAPRIRGRRWPSRRRSRWPTTDDPQIRGVLREHARLPVDVDTLDDDADLFAAGMTSHASVNLMLALEDAFDLEFPDAC